MNRFCSGLCLTAALSAQAISKPAIAADLSRPSAPVYTKAQPIAAVGYDWSGFYAGAHVGYDWGRAHVIDNAVLTENAVRSRLSASRLATVPRPEPRATR